MTALTTLTPNDDYDGPAFAVPPHDLDAEKAVLGAMLMSKYAIDECADIVIPQNFYHPKHAIIFDAITWLHWNQQPADAITVADHLARVGDALDRIGGASYLHELVASVVTAANATYYAGIVSDKALQRQLIESATKILQMGYAATGTGGEVDDLVGSAQAEIDSVARGQVTELVEGSSIIDDVLEATWEDRVTLTSPWPSLNAIIDGYEPGRVYTVAARPGGGKSIAMLDTALWFMRKHKKAAAITSLEMPANEVLLRALANMSGVDYRKIKNPREMNDFQLGRLREARDEFKRLPTLWIDDRPDQTVEMMRSFVRQAKNRSDLGFLGVDYVQLFKPSAGRKFGTRQEEVAHMSRQIKMTAKAMEIPVMMLAQLNRVEGKPKLTNLRESGSLEQDSDVVILLHREMDEQTGVPSSDLDAIVAKHRSGPQDGFSLYFDGARMRFTEHPDPIEGL